MTEEVKLPHKLTIQERRNLTVTGVAEVVSFDENSVVLRTGLGPLVIQGEGLQLKMLSPEGGQASVDGTITALAYVQEQNRGGWFRKLLG